MTTMLINGEPLSIMACNDRAVQYGDGLFETIALRNGQLELWAQHMARMRLGCQRLNLPLIDEQIWLNDIAQLRVSGNAVIKLLQSRGVGGRGYYYNDDIKSTRVVCVHDWPNYPQQWSEQGVTVCVCQTPVSANKSLAGIKHLNRLDNVLARNEWHDTQIAEGLMADHAGNVIEGTMSNLFAVKNNILFTPVLNDAGVRGVMRDHIVGVARSHQLSVNECAIKMHDLFAMDELFLTNSIIGIWPVTKLEHKQFSAGALTQKLKQLLLLEQAANVSSV